MMKRVSSPGADEEDVPAYPAFAVFFRIGRSTTAVRLSPLRSEFDLSIGAFNATINDDLPDSRFFSPGGDRRSRYASCP